MNYVFYQMKLVEFIRRKLYARTHTHTHTLTHTHTHTHTVNNIINKVNNLPRLLDKTNANDSSGEKIVNAFSTSGRDDYP